MRKNDGLGISFLAGVGVGALIGITVALLTAPKSGAETREDLKVVCDTTKEKAHKYAAIAHEKALEYAELAQNYAAIAAEKGEAVIDCGKDILISAKKKIKTAVAEIEAEDEAEIVTDSKETV